ncbi:hypothetical protein MJO29_008920, partial [Puccinia striiformis f. sp. tritici]
VSKKYAKRTLKGSLSSTYGFICGIGKQEKIKGMGFDIEEADRDWIAETNDLEALRRKKINSKIDVLTFAGFFLVSHTFNPREGKQFLTWATLDDGPLDLEPNDHKDIRLFYKSGIIKKLVYSEAYWLSGAVLGTRSKEMPFFDCELEGSEARSTQFMTCKPTTLNSVGSITKVIEREGGVDLHVKHQVDEYTTFGDEIIYVIYHLCQVPFHFEKNLEVGQWGKFGGILVGWSRRNGCLYA